MFSGNILMITGATGIAAATARLAAAEGARLFIAALPAEDCEHLASETGAAYYSGDLSVEEHANAAVAACVERYGAVNAIFNVAGISGRRFGDGPVHECSVEGWDVTLANNARSAFLMCRGALRQMMKQSGGGSILNMASVLAFSPEPRYFATHAYAASKGAIIALTTAMASYYAPFGIRANAIAPALVDTPMSRRAQESAEIQAHLRHKQPLREGMITADEVACAALFLLGNASSSITGQVLTVDAGWCVSH